MFLLKKLIWLFFGEGYFVLSFIGKDYRMKLFNE